MAFEGLFFYLFLSIIFLILAALYKHYKKTKEGSFSLVGAMAVLSNQMTAESGREKKPADRILSE